MKNAIITGSSRGLGRAIAEALVREGYRVWLSARSMDELIRVREELRSLGNGAIEIHAVDFNQDAAVKAYASTLLASCDTVDVLVNNAGIYRPDTVDAPDHFDEQMAVNFQAAYTLTQALLHRFTAQQSGYIFNICSIVNRKPRAEAASYTVSKFALWGYHQVLHRAMLDQGVTVCAFFPGSINTSSWDGMDVPHEQFIQPDDIARMIVAILQMHPGTVPSEIDLSSRHPDY